MLIIINILIIASLSFIYYKKVVQVEPKLYTIALVFRFLAATAVGVIYGNYYTSDDTWLFFSDAQEIARNFYDSPNHYFKFLLTGVTDHPELFKLISTEERTIFFVRLISILVLITGGNYWISSLYLALISFFASWFLYKVVNSIFLNSREASAISFLFMPSVVFWSSGLLKETLALAGIYFISAQFLIGVNNKRISAPNISVSIFAFLLVWILKYYWAGLFGAVLVATLSIYALSDRINVVKNHLKISWLMLFCLLIIVVSFVNPNFNLDRILEVIVTNHDLFIKLSGDSLTILYHDLKQTWLSLMINAPLALVSALFRPFLWEANNITSMFAAVENLLLVVLFISAIISWSQRKWNSLIGLACLAYIISLAVFLALSAPNLGTLSRYRVGFMPFFVFLISYRNPIIQYLKNRFMKSGEKHSE